MIFTFHQRINKQNGCSAFLLIFIQKLFSDIKKNSVKVEQKKDQKIHNVSSVTQLVRNHTKIGKRFLTLTHSFS